MTLKNYKPITPSLRHRIIVKKPKTLIKLNKELIKIKKKHAGRNNSGKITIRHRGSKSDHKRYLRLIDRSRIKGIFCKSKVLDIQYDPNITGFIALLEPCKSNNFEDNKLRQARYLILAPSGLKKGDIIEGSNYNKIYSFIASHYTNLFKYKLDEDNIKMNELNLGINRKLKDLPIGSYIYNLNKLNYARAAGSYCILLKTQQTQQIKSVETELVNTNESVIRLPSKKIININSDYLASLGQVSNEDHNLTIKGKAGANRWIGRRPKVRGDAKNPVDHPMGGKTHGSGGRGKPKKTAWGKLAKGQRKKK